MASTIDTVTNAIKARLNEIEDERKRLERALASLNGGSGPSRRSQPTKPSGIRRGGQRAKRGEREAQLLASIQRNPNYKSADHAREMGVSSNQVYGLVTKMTKAGTISKNAKGILKAKAS